MKICIQCDEPKEIDEYYRSKNTRDGHVGVCKDCAKQRAKESWAIRSKSIVNNKRARAKFPFLAVVIYLGVDRRVTVTKITDTCIHCNSNEIGEAQKHRHIYPLADAKVKRKLSDKKSKGEELCQVA